MSAQDYPTPDVAASSPNTTSAPITSAPDAPPDISSSMPAPDVTSLPNQPEPAMPQGPPKPSLWKSILAGALTGLAAGSKVDSRGMGTGGAFAAGMGAGAGAELARPAQQDAQ